MPCSWRPIMIDPHLVMVTLALIDPGGVVSTRAIAPPFESAAFCVKEQELTEAWGEIKRRR
jgi:hypothetical protein